MRRLVATAAKRCVAVAETTKTQRRCWVTSFHVHFGAMRPFRADHPQTWCTSNACVVSAVRHEARGVRRLEWRVCRDSCRSGDYEKLTFSACAVNASRFRKCRGVMPLSSNARHSQPLASTRDRLASANEWIGYLVDPASRDMLISKIKPCMRKSTAPSGCRKLQTAHYLSENLLCEHSNWIIAGILRLIQFACRGNRPLTDRLCDSC